MEVRVLYYGDKEEYVRKEENCNITPLYIRAPGSIRTIPLVVIHKGVEVVVVRVSASISVVNVWLGKQIDWAVIDHKPWGVASSTDPKVANVIRMSPSMTEITLGLQTMMCRMAGHCLPAGRTDVHWAKEPMVTEIRANVTLGVGRGGARALNEDSGC